MKQPFLFNKTAPLTGVDEIHSVRERFLRNMLVVSAIAGLPALLIAARESREIGYYAAPWFYLGLYVTVLLTTVFKGRISFAWKTFILFGAFFALGVHNLFHFGFSGAGIHVFLLVSVLMTVLLGRSAGILAMTTGLVCILAVGLAMNTGIVEVGIDLNAVNRSMLAWLSAAGVFILLAGAGVLLPGKLQSELARSLDSLKTRSRELSNSNAELKRRMEERKQMEEERQKLDAQLLQSQKRESIGALAGGIAHDFNNILFGIIGFTEIAKADLPEGSPNTEYLAQVLKGCDRAKALVKQILAFSRQAELDMRPLRIQQPVEDALGMLRSSLPTSIEISLHVDRDLPVVVADSTQIHQVIMNLCTNAAHAMENEHGIIKVTLDQTRVDENGASQARELAPGVYVRLRVSDTGGGIPSEILDRIFDPYFTTKEVGKGTGLGLAVVYGIVKDYGGEISVESEEGKGTTFTIHIPAMEGLEPQPLDYVCRSSLPTGGEHILFVDDEPTIAMLGRATLERLGYRVTIRQSSVEALELFRNDPYRFDLVVTDMTMPRMTGDELARAMLLIRPDIPIIICTGYSRQISNESAGEIGIRAFVMKPLTQHELARTVRRVLDEKPRK